MNKEVIFKLKKERSELEEKRNKLETALYNKNEFTTDYKYYMRTQLEIMNNYIDILSKRINEIIYVVDYKND